MWFRLAGADWSGDGNSLGPMSSISGSWAVQCTTSGGISKTTGAGFVTQGGTWTGTFTLSTGAEFTSATLTPSTAGTVTPSTSGSTVTVTIANVSANCTLSVVATSGSVEPETPVNPPTSLDDIAYEGKTYREIFITNNRAPDINNNSMNNAFGNISYTNSTGTTSIVTDETAAANYVPPYSLKVSGTSSQQAKSSWIANETTAFLLAANIKVTDYTKGYCGMIYGTEFQACADRITDGYEVFVGITPEHSASQLFIGSAKSANLTGYINNPVAVRTSLFTIVPTAETFTELYKNYTALLIAGNK